MDGKILKPLMRVASITIAITYRSPGLSKLIFFVIMKVFVLLEHNKWNGVSVMNIVKPLMHVLALTIAVTYPSPGSSKQIFFENVIHFTCCHENIYLSDHSKLNGASVMKPVQLLMHVLSLIMAVVYRSRGSLKQISL